MTGPPISRAATQAPLRASIVHGLPSAIDLVAEHGAGTHAFLRAGWYAAAVGAADARTLLVERAGAPVLALPLIALGPQSARLFGVPGSYWPFRSFPLAGGVGKDVAAAALAAAADEMRALRIGPVYDDDPAAAALIAAARGSGWAVMARDVARGWRLDLIGQPEPWPRTSTLRKNRFHEKHLASRGTLGWRVLGGADWPASFVPLGAVEDRSWVANRTDGGDAKFTERGHGAFWRQAARDPVLAAMFHAALLTVDGVPVAFSFDVKAGTTSYAIANSYDPAFAKHSPGKLLQWRNLVAARRAGIATVDWGAGDSGYKRVIGAVEGPLLRDWLLIRPGWSAAIGRLLSPAWQRSGQAVR